MRAFLLPFLSVLFLLAGQAGASDDLARAPRNFHVVDAQVFRGGEVTPGSVAWLKAKGVKTIIKLDDENMDEASWGIDVHPYHINKLGLNLSFDLVTGVLNDILQSSARGAVYVHCEYGSDRTGLIIALYRILKGWPKEQAIAEMNDPEFGHSALQVWIDWKADEYGDRLEDIVRRSR